jgi:hypothetical protein
VLSLKSNYLSADGGILLAEGLKGNSVITELDISSNYLGVDSDYEPEMSGVIALADVIPDMRALSSANLLKNHIPVEQAQELVKTMRAKQNLTTLCGLSGKETGLDFSGQDLEAGDAVLIANDIKDNGAMTKFDISSNKIRAEGGKALAEGLKGNQVIKELNFSGNTLGYNSNGDTDASGIIAIADVIPGMRALFKIIFGGGPKCDGSTEWEEVPYEPVTLEVGMDEADFSNKDLGTGGAIIIGAWLTHKDKGALTKLDARSNYIGDDGEVALKKSGQEQVGARHKLLSVYRDLK